MNPKLLKDAKIQLSEYLESLDGIEILAYRNCVEDNSTEFLVIESTVPKGLSGDFFPCFYLLVLRDEQWKLDVIEDTDDVMEWAVDEDKNLFVVSADFYYLGDDLC
jgi:hypothetical protein